jgi:c(7)-type cytochrome triheme protein
MISRLTLLIPVMIISTAALGLGVELKDITFTTKDAGKVVFSHKTHLGKKTRTASNLSCKTCHESGKLKMRHYTMAEMEKGKSCGACHDGAQAFNLAKCTRCHKVKEITYKVKETGPVLFSHNRHLRTMQCSSCHSSIFKAGPNPRTTMAQMEKGKSCGACHDGKGGFKLSECVKCHPFKDKSYTVADAGDVLFSHKFHTGMYSCSECHPRLYLPGKGNVAVTMAGMEAQNSCGACHDGKSAFTVKENCEKCHQMGKK